MSRVPSLRLTIFTVLQLALRISGKHVCDRPCVQGEPMTCTYDFKFQKYYTMTKGCFNCPFNVTDCYRPTCISANGVVRIFYTANLQLPGPIISICQNDTLIVNVDNRLSDMVTTLHHHGITQIGTPYMDGVPLITQCPIQAYDTFQYKFRVYQSGTYFWHSHVTYQIVDGLASMLVIRQPPGVDPNGHLYDFDLNEHAILINDWNNATGSVIDGFHYEVLNDLPFIPAIIVNGRGQMVYYRTEDGSNIYTPLSEFKVKAGYRYRFRICNNVNGECPTMMSIDGHSMTIIATDGNPVKPYTVDAIVMGQAERYDFILNANHTTGNFWIRFQGRGKLSFCSGSYSAANLKYEGSDDVDLTQLYVPSQSPIPNAKILSFVTNLTSLKPIDRVLKGRPKSRFYFAVGDLANYKPLFYNPKYFPWSSFNSSYQMPLPLINGIALTYPPSPLLTQLNDVPKDILCNASSLEGVKNCSAEYCSCVHRVKIPLGALAELVILDVGEDSGYHSFHLHGYTFRVVGQQSMVLGQNTIENFKKLDSQGKIKRKFDGAVLKDTVRIPYAGYAIIRFLANNPGFWFFHCHMDFHLESGMGMVIQVGEPHEFSKPPSNMPVCGNFFLNNSTNHRTNCS